jgi:hypothetical protein
MLSDEASIRVRRPTEPLDDEVAGNLRSALDRCPDVAFAHLVEVDVEGHQEGASLTLFVWLLPEAMRSLRAALNLVSDSVAGALAEGTFVDVVILNSAPELLGQVEGAGCLFVERDAGERARAIEAAAADIGETVQRTRPPRRWWWPFDPR